MIKTTINLLSESKKVRLNFMIKFLCTKNLLEIILLVSAVLAVALVLGWRVLVDEFSAVAESATLIDRVSYAQIQEIKKINSVVKDIELASREFTPLTPKLSELFAVVPGDIKLTSLSIDRRQKTVRLAGIAKSRIALLSFKERLSRISWVEKITSPASQLLQKENIDFEISGNLKGFPLLTPEKTSNKRPASVTTEE